MNYGQLNAQKDKWEIITSMPYPVTGCQAVVIDSLIYIVGGKSDSLGAVGYVQEYNPRSNKWRIAGSLKTNRFNLIAANYKNSILICGGIGKDTMNEGSLEFWNLNGSSTIGNNYNINFKRNFFTSQIKDDKLYLIGGNINGMPMRKIPYIIEYNLEENKITYSNDILYANNLPLLQMSVIADDNIYILGGIKFGISKDVIKFNTENYEIETLDIDLSRGRAGGAAVYGNNGNIYLIGGTNESLNPLSSVEVYSVENHDRLTAPSLNYRREYCSAVLYDNAIYVFGGSNSDNEAVPEVEKYELPTTYVENLNRGESLDFRLNSSYPNPFNSSTTINYDMLKNGFVALSVYDILGNKISTLVNEEKPSGHYKFRFDASTLASGFYIVKLTVNSKSSTQKIVLIK